MTKLSLKESILFELLKLALCDKQPNLDIFEGLTANNWSEVITLSVEQGVQAIVFDGAMKLPCDIQPPRNLKLKWIVNVDVIEKRFEKYINSCAELVKIYAQSDIKVMVLKGIGLAYLYPVPHHREGGDIDIWLFGKYKQGNEVIEKHGIELRYEDKKHMVFYFNGIPIESHRTFLNSDMYKVDMKLEIALKKIIKSQQCDMIPLPLGEFAFAPAPTFNAIFLARHMVTHFYGGIVVRHLCDWSVFLKKYYGKFDTQYVIEEFRKAGILELVAILSNICVKHLDLPKQFNPFESVESPKLEARIFKDILVVKKVVNSSNPFRIFIHKTNRFCKSLWKAQLVHRVSKSYIIWKSIKSHITNPYLIFKQ